MEIESSKHCLLLKDIKYLDINQAKYVKFKMLKIRVCVYTHIHRYNGFMDCR